MAKWLLVALLVVHGAIHVLGVVKAFGSAEVPQLASPISRGWGIVWAACTALLAATAIARVANWPSWWMLGALGFVSSQVAIVAFWSDAKFGTVANVLLVIPLVVGFGSWRFDAQTRQDLSLLRSQLSEPTDSSVVSAAELSPLPPPVARWLETAGVVGRPRAGTVYLTQRGSMQKSPGGDWMPFVAEQWFTVPTPGFLWLADVDTGLGTSLAGRDRYIGGTGAMRIELLSLVPVVNASGPTIDQGTLVRFLAETMWFPSAALLPYLEWQKVDDRSARVTMRYGDVEASGLFRFGENGDVTAFEAKRYRDEVLENWLIENDPSTFSTLDGVRIPIRSTITWRNDAGELWTWLKLEVSSVQRDPKFGH